MASVQSVHWCTVALWEAATVILVSTVLWLALGDSASPGGPVFALEAVFVAGVLGGRCTEWLKRRSGVPLPALLGMLLFGVALRNIPGPRALIGEAVDKGSSSSLRTAALALILARAGLGLDLAALRRLKWAALCLAALPCAAEATTVALLSSVLFDLPPAWAALLGFVVAAVSPAVVVPSLLSLQAQGYGTKSGIPTLVVAAAALDDVFSLAGFGVAFSFALPNGAHGRGVLPSGVVWADAIRAPLELALGCAVAALGATALRRASGARAAWRGAWSESFERCTTLLLFCLLATFALKRAGFAGASALATLALSAACADDWGPAASSQAGAHLSVAWSAVAQPALFALLGVAVDLSTLSAATAGLAVAMLALSGIVRLLATSLAVSGFGLNRKERLFVALAWLPKATVQAAVGAVALDAATGTEQTRRARVVLAVAVVAIVLTAPLGAVAIAIAGPKLLTKEDHTTVSADENDAPLQTASVGLAGAGATLQRSINQVEAPVESGECELR